MHFVATAGPTLHLARTFPDVLPQLHRLFLHIEYFCQYVPFACNEILTDSQNGGYSGEEADYRKGKIEA